MKSQFFLTWLSCFALIEGTLVLAAGPALLQPSMLVLGWFLAASFLGLFVSLDGVVVVMAVITRWRGTPAHDPVKLRLSPEEREAAEREAHSLAILIPSNNEATNPQSGARFAATVAAIAREAPQSAIYVLFDSDESQAANEREVIEAARVNRNRYGMAMSALSSPT